MQGKLIDILLVFSLDSYGWKLSCVFASGVQQKTESRMDNDQIRKQPLRENDIPVPHWMPQNLAYACYLT